MQKEDIFTTLESSKLYGIWVKLYVAGVLFIFFLFGLLPFTSPFIEKYHLDLYKAVGLLLVCSFLFFRRVKDGLEFKLIFLYGLWLCLARIIDRGLFSDGATGSIFDITVCLPLLGFAMVISAEKRLNWLDIIAIMYCAAYALVGVLCIYGTVNQITAMDYIKEGIRLYYFEDGRLHVLGVNCNLVALWYYIACMLLLYLFFRCKNTVSRILTIVSFFVCYLILALTFSRSTMISFAISIGMLAILIVFHYCPQLTPAKKAITLVVLMCLCVFVTYKSFNVSVGLLSSISLSEAETTQNSDNDTSDGSGIDQKTVEKLNDRGFSSSGRTGLWKAAILSLLEDPGRIVTGRADKISIDLTNQYIENNMPDEYARYGERLHHHNAYLDILMTSGLPGFLLMMVFFVVLVIKMIRMFFSQTESIGLDIKVLVILLTGIMVYNFFETSFFYHFNRLSTAAFCIVSGYVIAFEKELRRRKVSE